MGGCDTRCNRRKLCSGRRQLRMRYMFHTEKGAAEKDERKRKGRGITKKVWKKR